MNINMDAVKAEVEKRTVGKAEKMVTDIAVQIKGAILDNIFLNKHKTGSFVTVMTNFESREIGHEYHNMARYLMDNNIQLAHVIDIQHVQSILINRATWSQGQDLIIGFEVK